MKIGYQGDIENNNETAAKEFAKRKDPDNKLKWEFIPLINSSPVLSALDKGEIDFGCCAVFNSLGGEVKETADALRNRKPTVVDEIILPIHHCLFIKEGTTIENCKSVVSHIQALKQTKINRNKLFPELVEAEVKDQALAAKQLADGTISDTTAVICKKERGLELGLKLVYENLEDNLNNWTTFNIYRNGELND